MASAVAVTRAGACRRAETPLASDEEQGDRPEQDVGTAWLSFYDCRLQIADCRFEIRRLTITNRRGLVHIRVIRNLQSSICNLQLPIPPRAESAR